MAGGVRYACLCLLEAGFKTLPSSKFLDFASRMLLEVDLAPSSGVVAFDRILLVDASDPEAVVRPMYETRVPLPIFRTTAKTQKTELSFKPKASTSTLTLSLS